VLIEAAKDYLPSNIAQRPKRGFSFPILEWMKSDFEEIVHETCDPRVVRRRGWVDPDYWERIYRKELGLYPEVWSMLVLELWARTFLD